MIVLFMVIRLLLSDMLVGCVGHSFQDVSFLAMVFNLITMDFDLSWPVGDTFF